MKSSSFVESCPIDILKDESSNSHEQSTIQHCPLYRSQKFDPSLILRIQIVLTRQQYKILGDQLIHWHTTVRPRYPWIGERDPYKILLSEFLLQQTRSDQALPYYRRILDAYPTMQDLAESDDDLFMQYWQGLGYYRRARNLLACVRTIITEFDGAIPKTFDELLSLPGIGPYTAAAISSFAFGARHAVVDGNVYRAISRLRAIDTPIPTTTSYKTFYAEAMNIMGDNDSASFNQAIMNLGAQICTPAQPQCHSCPWQESCIAVHTDSIAQFPVQREKKARRARFLHFIVIQYRDHYILRRRDEKDVWQHLWTFPHIETTHDRPLKKHQLTSLWNRFTSETIPTLRASQSGQQLLTHQRIVFRFYEIHLSSKPKIDDDNTLLVNRENLQNFAYPKPIKDYIQMIVS